MIATRSLAGMLNIGKLRRCLQSLAMLDAIVRPEWEYRYYSFNSTWDKDEQMGSMRNGSGDHFYAHFSPAGCWIKGFDHESPMSPFRVQPNHIWPGVLDTVPQAFENSLKEPAFRLDETTFCIWRAASDPQWRTGEVTFPVNVADPDGSENLLALLDGRPESYEAWASEYYEQPINLAAVKHVYEHKPLTFEVVAGLNSDLSIDDLAEDIVEIGYPPLR